MAAREARCPRCGALLPGERAECHACAIRDRFAERDRSGAQAQGAPPTGREDHDKATEQTAPVVGPAQVQAPAKEQQLTTEDKARKKGFVFCGGCLGLFVLVGVILCIYTEEDVNRRKRAEQTADTPQRLAESIVATPEARVSAYARDGGITVELSTDPWVGFTVGSAKGSFLVIVRRLVPTMLDRFPDAQWVRVNATQQLVDLRGNPSRELVMTIGFTRTNANTIRWQNVVYDDLPKVADEWWIHPVMLK